MIIPSDIICYTNGKFVGEIKSEFELAGIIASECIYEVNSTSKWHYHSNLHFSHILNGGSIELNEKGQKVQTAGMSLYYKPEVPHQNCNYLKNTRIFNLEILPSFIASTGLKLKYQDELFEDTYKHFKKNILLKLVGEYFINDCGSQLSFQQLCLQLLIDKKAEKEIPSNRHWSKILSEFLYSYQNEKISLNDIANELGVHPVTISKYFSKYFGCTMGEYIRRIKIEKALQYIRDRKNSLTEIAYLCGFSDQAHFTHTFKKITGFLPKDYRAI